MSKNAIYKSLVEFHLFWESMSDKSPFKKISLQELWPLKEKSNFQFLWNEIYETQFDFSKKLRKLAKQINNAVYLPGVEEQLNREMEKNQQGRTSSKR